MAWMTAMEMREETKALDVPFVQQLMKDVAN